jgi:Flp pilus assembly protein TadG
MNRLYKLWRDRSGASALEFALVAPVFVLLITGIFQTGMGFYANAGLRSGVESAARYAQIYPTPTDSQITTQLSSNTFGLNPALLSTPTLTHGTSNGQNYVDISATYNFPLKILFMPSTTIALNYSRRAYQY